MSAKLFDIPDKDKPHVIATISDKALAYRCDKELDRLAGCASKLAEAAGFSIVQSGGRIRVEGFADPTNGMKTITATGCPAIYIKPSSVPYPHDTARFVSEASDWASKPSEVAALLFPSSKARLALYAEHFRAAVVKPVRFTAARYDGLFTVDCNTVKAITDLLPAEHGLEVELLLISAYDPQQADDIAKHKDAPFATVNITSDGEPRTLAWHGQRPSTQEVACYDGMTARKDEQRRREIGRETREFRAQKLRAAGLRVT
jgi:hypothetical protein